MPLNHGDVWKGLDTLRVEDQATGEVLTDGCIVMDMDIDADEGLITMIVSSDIG
jgi:hypothetical protein